MGVVTYDMEIASPIAPVKLFKAFVLDADNLIPKILPQAIKSVEILEGDRGHGPIKFTFGEGSQLKTMKQRIDGIDKKNFTYSYTIIDGDALVGTLESISNEIKILPSPKQQYITKGDIEITEEQIKGGKETYLLANPDAE